MNEVKLGIEIGGTKLQAALGTAKGQIITLERSAAPTQGNAQAILQWFSNAVPKLIRQAKSQAQPIRGIGVGFGGLVEPKTGKTLISHQVEGWNYFPLKSWFEEHFQIPTTIINDSNAAGWAEYKLGAGRGTKHFFYMNIGSGIGGALIIDGKLHDGQGFGAAEIGHTCIPDWTRDTPGAVNRLEQLCSGWSLEKRLQEMDSFQDAYPEGITAKQLAETARTGGPDALAAINAVAQGIGIALANTISLIHPQRIAIGGGVSLMGDILFQPIRRHAAEHVIEAFRGRYEILPSELGESVVLAGAMLLAPD